MNSANPVYTLQNECQDCYKCVRVCAVKAIKIRDGHAEVMPERCVACGACVANCPAGAKRIRSDLEKVRNLLRQKKKVIVSLAPSWRGVFGYTPARMIAVLQALGFAAVSETALGAQEVSIRTAQILNEADGRLYISSACPVIVDYVRLYQPEAAPCLLPLASPLLTHAKFLQDHCGRDIAVVFIGPCIGKKNEADRNPELLAAALTFADLKYWLKEAYLDVETLPDADKKFLPETAHEGSLYPLGGSMNETIRRVGVRDKVRLINICSLALLDEALKGLVPQKLDKPTFIEALACVGGCIAGPCAAGKRPRLLMMSEVLDSVQYRTVIPPEPRTVVPYQYPPAALPPKRYAPEELQAALKKLGKHTPEDELNCSGCGYNTCRDLAQALLDGTAEISMCVSYMRKTATRKAAALLKSMPSALIMLDKNLAVLEVNEACHKMFKENEIADFFPLFRTTLRTGQDLHQEHYVYKNRLYDLHVFSVEPDEVVGALITDVTRTQEGRERVAGKAREVIAKNIATVQEIASLLGEHMVETEALLDSIAADYSDYQED
ncbi:signal transduction histidine kinase [Candidatus Termititenax persephonae]|uniref:Signal transduction histidine kinase n=1 Tax=Candidatus Termititenax persephonae TaxID=2218525 RepID=A0A388TFA8_9BACT|nr:signal transduction histidine kinase [Candidatus Termititenax persephonae]